VSEVLDRGGLPAAGVVGVAGTDAEQTQRLAQLIAGARSVVALTGAGISVPSGIPDFRTPGTGLWEKVDPMEVAHIDAFHADPVRFWSFYGQRFATLGDKLPNGAHRALVAMEQRGLLDAVITQNIDMLHRTAGTCELIEMHGSIAGCSCLSCGGSVPVEEVRARLGRAEDGVPRCEDCGRALKPDVVLFGELLSQPSLDRARELCEAADLLLCVGSSLEVHPVAGLPRVTLASGGRVAILTQGPTPLDGIADVRLAGDMVAELQALCAVLGLDVS
jgi:NAD-dependent deacetylase